MRCIKMTIPRTWLYKGKEHTVRDLMSIKECSESTLSRLLKDVPKGTEIDSIIDAPKVRKLSKYRYRGTLHSTVELADILQCPISRVYNKIRYVDVGSDVDDILDNISVVARDRFYYVIYEGKRVSKKELAKCIGMSATTLARKLKDVPSGTDVTKFDFTVNTRWFIYDGKAYKASGLADALNVKQCTISAWLRGIENGTDVTCIIKERNVDRRWVYHSELLCLKEIAHLCGKSSNFVRNKLIGVKEKECVDDIIDKAISVMRTPLDWNGKQMRISEIANEYGLSFDRVYGAYKRYGVYKLREYMDVYGGDRRLEIAKRYRSNCDYICDNLWVYKNPETGEETVLATEDINKLEVSECQK